MKNGTEKYIETVAYLGKLYDFVNAKLFGGELVKPVITIQTDERNKTNGWWSVKKVWKWIDKEPANCAECDTPNDCENYTECYKPVEREEHELNMTAQQLHRPIELKDELQDNLCYFVITISVDETAVNLWFSFNELMITLDPSQIIF